MKRLLFIFFFVNVGFLKAQEFYIELDTILFTNLALSAKQSKNFHIDVYDEYLYTLYYKADVHRDILSVSKYNLENYKQDTFQIEIKGLADEILRYRKWNTDGIGSFNIISKDTFLIAFNHKYFITTKDKLLKHSKKIDQLYECLLFDGKLLIIDYNTSAYDHFFRSNRLDTISFYTVNSEKPKLIYDHPFIFSEAISIQPNHFWDVHKDKILLTDVNGSISYLNSQFELLDQYHSDDKIPVNNRRLSHIRKKHRDYIMVMTKLSEILWSPHQQFTRDIHFVNDSTFFLYKKWLKNREGNQEFKILFYRIINDEIKLLAKMNESSQVSGIDEIYNKENFPTNFAGATKIFTSNNKIIKINRLGINKYPLGCTIKDYNDLKYSEILKGGDKLKTQIQIFNVLEKN